MYERKGRKGNRELLVDEVASDHEESGKKGEAITNSTQGSPKWEPVRTSYASCIKPLRNRPHETSLEFSYLLLLVFFNIYVFHSLYFGQVYQEKVCVNNITH